MTDPRWWMRIVYKWKRRRERMITTVVHVCVCVCVLPSPKWPRRERKTKWRRWTCERGAIAGSWQRRWLCWIKMRFALNILYTDKCWANKQILLEFYCQLRVVASSSSSSLLFLFLLRANLKYGRASAHCLFSLLILIFYETRARAKQFFQYSNFEFFSRRHSSTDLNSNDWHRR